jgi:hypothetical protein
MCMMRDVLTDAHGCMHIQALSSLRAVGQDLFIQRNPKLQSLEGLSTGLKLVGTYLGGDLYVTGNSALGSLSGLGQNLQSVRGLVKIDGNPVPPAEVDAVMAKAPNGSKATVVVAPASVFPAAVPAAPVVPAATALPAAKVPPSVAALPSAAKAMPAAAVVPGAAVVPPATTVQTTPLVPLAAN